MKKSKIKKVLGYSMLWMAALIVYSATVLAVGFVEASMIWVIGFAAFALLLGGSKLLEE